MSDSYAENEYVAPKPLHVQLYESYRAQVAKHGINIPAWEEASDGTQPPVIGPWVAVEQFVLRYYREAFTGPVRVGCVVRLRGGGPMMTVTEVPHPAEVVAEWHADSGEPMKATYPIMALTVEHTPKPRVGTAVEQAASN